MVKVIIMFPWELQRYNVLKLVLELNNKYRLVHLTACEYLQMVFRSKLFGSASVSIFVVLRPVPSELIGQIEEIIKCIPRGKSERCQVRGKHCHNH